MTDVFPRFERADSSTAQAEKAEIHSILVAYYCF
ncbi:hypothetical protein swp_1372 [Shewanella piezotolerans WP3]|uniref:Uncharacterized protein n=1 Tax=Shewanella piezotolerans (strain WP3 / JCM 13877) TaxID=225849 RepID=B8CJR3_SHEPW|nr:hypothetical protein swp_1372 [Shewanella piezotolerans WP3]